MTRDEAKKQMRIEMTTDLSAEELNNSLSSLGGLTPNQVMKEVDQGTEVGENFLTEFVVYAAAKGPLDETTRNHVIAMMEKDLKSQEPEFADQPWIYYPDQSGEMYTPNQMIEQVRQGTDFGNLYAGEWMMHYGRYINTKAIKAKSAN